MPRPEPKALPTEVELILDVMPCQAMRRSYDSAQAPHPCSHFAEWGVYHSFDYAEAGAPPTPGVEQPSVYRGKRPLLPEVLSGCRKAPIMCVGINPNLPGWWPGDRSAVNPYFEDYLQYAHYFRYRSTAKLRIPKPAYEALRAGAPDGPTVARPLVPDGSTIALERDPVTMYLAYQSLLDGLAQAEGWAGHHLAIGEDLSYANMVACPSARWTERPSDDATMPVMGIERAAGIVKECFVDRKYFLRQLFQSLPAVLLAFSATTAKPFIRAMHAHFRPEGAPSEDERLDDLIKREIRLEFGRLHDGTVLDARVLFMPHASARPEEFKKAVPAVIEQLREEVAAGRLVFRPETGHLARPRGGCLFCSNELYRIGPCDFVDELKPLEHGAVVALDAGAGPAARSDTERERAVQERLLDAFLKPPQPETAGAVVVALDAAAPSAPPLVLLGKVVTMTGQVLDTGAVYLRAGSIDAVLDRTAAPPAGYGAAARLETGGVIYPGLLDLHNHLAYNIIPLWNAGRAFENRNDWIKRSRGYKRFVSVPMGIVAGEQAGLIKPVVRYVEAKLLMGGVTSGQGMNSIFGGNKLYRGLLRNFEQSDDPGLPSANHLVPDIKDTPETIEKFRKQLSRRFFFHLAEGRDAEAHAQFELLDRNSLLAANLIAIHCAGLQARDFAKLKAAGSKVVWSPFSNLLLYGKTLDIGALVQAGVPFSLGSDWTPSGSRNLLFEMKVAFLAAKEAGAAVSAQTLAEAVTVRAASSVGWGDKLGTLEPGRYADILVLDDAKPDAYENLLHATERSVRLVVVAGHVRYGDAGLVDDAGVPAAKAEAIMVGGRSKSLNLEHPASPLNGLSLDTARRRLENAMSHLADTASAAVFGPLGAEAEEIELDLQAESDDESGFFALADDPPLDSLQLDPLTVLDDPSLFAQLAGMAHLPGFLRESTGIAAFYDREPPMKTRQISVLPTSDEAAALAQTLMEPRGKVDTVGALLLGRAADEDVAAMEAAGSIVEDVPETSEIGWLEPGKQPPTPATLADRAADPALTELATEGTNRYVIQFAGPLRPAWRDEIATLGVKLGAYVPSFAYKAALTEDQRRAVEQIANVRRVVDYGPEQTLRRASIVEARTRSRGGDDRAPDGAAVGMRVPTEATRLAYPLAYDVKCHDPNDLWKVKDVLEQDERVASVDRGRNRLRVHLAKEADAESLVSEIAALPQVSVVERFQVPTIDAAFVRAAMAVPAFQADHPGSTGGEGEVIGVADTGVDKTHPDLASRVADVRIWEHQGSPDDPVGHGTHVCGIICGDGSASAGAITGIAPRARVFVQAVTTDNGAFTGLPVDLATLFKEAYDAGVRIHNNSWGAVVDGLYTIDAFEIDEFAYQHPDFLIIIAAGNTGKQTNDPKGRMDLNSLQSPAASKNALTVGACCSTRTDGPYEGKPWSTWNGRFGPGPSKPLAANEPICGDADVIAAFSSRGPTDESRVKPDLVAPGTAVVSAASAASSPSLPFDDFGGRYCFMSGTSMAAPAVAGAAALVRRWYIKERDVATPSAALLKATLINGCVWIDREAVTDPMIGRPNFHQGFGRLDLSRTVPFTHAGWDLAFADIATSSPDALSDADRASAIWRRRLTVSAQGDLSVTLSWSDPPGHGLQHNLDLLVTAPGGLIVTGNQGLQRAPFEKLDRTNNVEQVMISDAKPGDYLIQVAALNTMSKKQGFSVVITGNISQDLS